MSTITESASKNGISDLGEISMLENFFQNPELKTTLNEAERFRKIRYLVLIPTVICGFFGAAYLGSTGIIPVEIGDTGMYRPSELLDGISWGIMLGFILFGIIVKFFKSKIEGAIKSKILTKLSKELYSRLDYDAGDTYAFGDLDILRGKNFIKSYDRVDYIEDSIGFKIEEDRKYLIAQGYELKTSEVRGSGKRRSRVTTNHCYLMKVRFPHARIALNSDLFIRTDEADSLSGSVIYFVLGGIFGLFGSFAIGIEAIGGILLIALLSGTIGYVSRRIYIQKKRVRLENVEFEKFYDVHCDDQIGSRMIITPAFMDRLVQLSKKGRYKYEFYYATDCFYIKWNIKGTYLEVNTWKNINTNIGTYVDWYSQMKDILLFIFEMRLLYLSRVSTGIIDVSELEYQKMVQSSPDIKMSNLFGEKIGGFLQRFI